VWGGDTGRVAENGEQLCVVVKLGKLGKMKHSCVGW